MVALGEAYGLAASNRGSIPAVHDPALHKRNGCVRGARLPIFYCAPMTGGRMWSAGEPFSFTRHPVAHHESQAPLTDAISRRTCFTLTAWSLAAVGPAKPATPKHRPAAQVAV